MFTGRKFDMSFLLGFPLSSGKTRAVFAKSGKMLWSILKLIDLVKSGARKAIATLIRFGGIVFIPVAFLEFNPCVSFFISISFTK